MLRGWNVSLDRDGTLEKISGKGMIWDAGAILEVPDPQCFEVKLSFPARAQGKRMPFILGITQTSFTGPIHEVPDLSKVFIEKNPTKCFVEFSKQNHKVHHCFIKEGSVKMEPMACMSAVSSLTLRYDSGSLTFSSEDKTSGPHNVPNTEYVPCVFLVEKNVPIVVHVSRKRKAAVEGLNDKLYRDRKFTDAEFVCMGRRIPVHRAVLSAASVVFERMWSSGLRAGCSGGRREVHVQGRVAIRLRSGSAVRLGKEVRIGQLSRGGRPTHAREPERGQRPRLGSDRAPACRCRGRAGWIALGEVVLEARIRAQLVTNGAFPI
mmetsp:Transcript_5275/g.17132  ORF Transcript_5275/g.17132 Transcript_5275/m.17132 type:complete len:321 (-) Transcript_5275:126-1088(-)